MRERPLTVNTRFAGDFEFFYALTANRARPHSLGLGLEAGQHFSAADCLERSLQAFARSTVARLAKENHRDTTLKAFTIPTPESALAEAKSGSHDGLYWEDKIAPDGCRTRNFLPNFFNAFWARACPTLCTV